MFLSPYRTKHNSNDSQACKQSATSIHLSSTYYGNIKETSTHKNFDRTTSRHHFHRQSRIPDRSTTSNTAFRGSKQSTLCTATAISSSAAVAAEATLIISGQFTNQQHQLKTSSSKCREYKKADKLYISLSQTMHRCNMLHKHNAI